MLATPTIYRWSYQSSPGNLKRMDTGKGAAPTRLRTLPSWLLTQTALHTQRLVTEGLAAADAYRYHYSLLSALEEFGPASQADLGRRCGIDRSDMVAMVNELTASKLIERTADASDRRRNIITITPAGRRRLRKLDRVVAGIQDHVLGPLALGERKQLVSLLTRVLDHQSTYQRGAKELAVRHR